MINAATDNPMVVADAGEIVSCGNFHGAQSLALLAPLRTWPALDRVASLVRARSDARRRSSDIARIIALIATGEENDARGFRVK